MPGESPLISTSVVPETAGPFPTVEVLEYRLSEAVSDAVRVVTRATNYHSSSFPTEFVTCSTGSGAPVRVFCKHFLPRPDHSLERQALAFYEIDVYQRLLRNVPMSLPAFVGAWTSPGSGEALLVLEYLDDCIEVQRATDSNTAMEAAAGWIGEFHAHCASLALRPEMAFLKRRDAEFYRGRCDRVVRNFGAPGGSHPWLRVLVDRFRSVLDVVEDVGPTIIHGEYYVSNVLLRGDRIVPVDWETTSIGAGETDIAALIGGWSRITEGCTQAYASARGLGGDGRAVARRLAAGQILLDIHWIAGIDLDTCPAKKLARADRCLARMLASAKLIGVF